MARGQHPRKHSRPEVKKVMKPDPCTECWRVSGDQQRLQEEGPAADAQRAGTASASPRRRNMSASCMLLSWRSSGVLQNVVDTPWLLELALYAHIVGSRQSRCSPSSSAVQCGDRL